MLLAASSDAERGQEDPPHEAGAAPDIRLGDTRAAAAPGRLRPPERALGLLDQPNTPQQRAPDGSPAAASDDDDQLLVRHLSADKRPQSW